MKKAISILLAVATMAFATSAMAATGTEDLDGNRNESVTTFVANPASVSSMPCFRPGDTVEFTINGISSGAEVTLVTYKYNQDLSNSTVQYINQYTATSSTQAVSYTVRDLGAGSSGVYQVDIKAGSNALVSFYYKIGKVTASMVTGPSSVTSRNAYAYAIQENYVPGGTYRQHRDWSVAFVGKVTIDSADITLADIGATPGFTIRNASGVDKTYRFGEGVNSSVTTIGTYLPADSEISGSYSFVYGMTIYGVSTGNLGTFVQATTALTD